MSAKAIFPVMPSIRVAAMASLSPFPKQRAPVGCSGDPLRRCHQDPGRIIGLGREGLAGAVLGLESVDPGGIRFLRVSHVSPVRGGPPTRIKSFSV